MSRGVYKRKKRGRPKGSRNKVISTGQSNFSNFPSPAFSVNIPTEPPSYLSRLEAATVKYEQAINEAVTVLKGQ